jgi:hypothetical protein
LTSKCIWSRHFGKVPLPRLKPLIG